MGDLAGLLGRSWASGLQGLLKSMGVLPEDENRLRVKDEPFTRVAPSKSGEEKISNEA